MPARAVLSGTISFGLVSIPVKFFTAASSEQVSFNMLHKKCGGRLKMQFHCPTDNEIVERSDTIKGYEYAKGQYVQFSEEELKALETERGGSIRDHRVRAGGDRGLFCRWRRATTWAPDKGGDKAYRLLRRGHDRQRSRGPSAAGRRVAKSRSCWCAPTAKTALLIHQLYYANEMRAFSEIDTGATFTFSEKEHELAGKLIDELGTDSFDASKYVDSFSERVKSAVDQKVAGQENHHRATKPPRLKSSTCSRPSKRAWPTSKKKAAPLAGPQKRPKPPPKKPRRQKAREKGSVVAGAAKPQPKTRNHFPSGASSSHFSDPAGLDTRLMDRRTRSIIAAPPNSRSHDFPISRSPREIFPLASRPLNGSTAKRLTAHRAVTARFRRVGSRGSRFSVTTARFLPLSEYVTRASRFSRLPSMFDAIPLFGVADVGERVRRSGRSKRRARSRRRRVGRACCAPQPGLGAGRRPSAPPGLSRRSVGPASAQYRRPRRCRRRSFPRYLSTSTPRSTLSPAPSASASDGRTPMPAMTRSASSLLPSDSVM